jgi:hypothetical protein
MLGDLTDILSTAAGRNELAPGAVRAAALVGGASALLSVALALAVER